MRAVLERWSDQVKVVLYEEGDPTWRVGSLWGDRAEVEYYRFETLIKLWCKEVLIAYLWVKEVTITPNSEPFLRTRDCRLVKEVANGVDA